MAPRRNVMKRVLALLVVLALLPLAVVSAQTFRLYEKEGVSLWYRLEPMGTKDVVITPEETQTLKFYKFTAWFENNSGKDVEMERRGQMSVSFFVGYSTAWTDGGQGSVDFPGVSYKAGSRVEGSSTFLLNPSYEKPGEPSWYIPPYKLYEPAQSTQKAAPAKATASSPRMTSLINRLATLYPKLKAGTASPEESQEILSISQEVQKSASTMTQEEQKRFLEILK
jgi:hypothetical protein